MSPAEAKAMADMMIQTLEREYATTRRVVAAIPENQLNFKLGEKGRTTLELAWHLISSEAWFADSIAAGDFNRAEPACPEKMTVAELVATYEKEVPAKTAKLKQLSGEQLAKAIPFFGMPPMPNAVYLGFWNSHSIHHRGQLSTYLRAMNAHVPTIYGGSADEPFEMPASA
jgi:uncharacterized damage-inducible protein DinB